MAGGRSPAPRQPLRVEPFTGIIQRREKLEPVKRAHGGRKRASWTTALPKRAEDARTARTQPEVQVSPRARKRPWRGAVERLREALHETLARNHG